MGSKEQVAMAYEATNNAGSPENPQHNKATQRSAFADHALLAFYIFVIAISMSGWLWFLGYLSWGLLSWVMPH
jgi:hypothetical protein